jgi:hypothetical protein
MQGQESDILGRRASQLVTNTIAGTIKRWNHKRGSMTHGSKSKRQHGSIGASATPSRVFPGLKMAGQMGNERKTIKALEVCLSLWLNFLPYGHKAEGLQGNLWCLVKSVGGVRWIG